MLRTIVKPDEAAAARGYWRTVADALRPRYAVTADLMDRSEDDVLAYMSFPKAHRAQMLRANPLERPNNGIKRRADVVCIFANEDSISRLVGALMLEQTHQRAVSRRYIMLETLASVSDDPFVSLSGVTV